MLHVVGLPTGAVLALRVVVLPGKRSPRVLSASQGHGQRDQIQVRENVPAQEQSVAGSRDRMRGC